MPGEFVSDGKNWKPARVVVCESGRIRETAFENPRIMKAVIKEVVQTDEAGQPLLNAQGNPIKHFQTVAEALGKKVRVEDDPAALSEIKKQTGEDVVLLELHAPPDMKTDQGELRKENNELRERLAKLEALLPKGK